MKVGIIGCGNISGIYFKNMCGVFSNLEVTACADLDIECSKAKAEEFESVTPMSVDELLASDVEIVVNLTIPAAHFDVAMAAVEAGKHVYGEKPVTLTREEGRKLLAAASERGLRVGNAPDTFMGAGIQTAVKLIDDGWIGKPVSATAFMLCHGHESWHPSPEFYYQVGGGPMFDMGPYYLTALVALMGPVKRVTGSTSMAFDERTITSEPKFGKKVTVEVPTHVTGLLDFAGGGVGTIITSFDVWGHNMPCIEIHGTEGSLSVPDPNGFGGEVKLKRGKGDWGVVPHSHAYPENSRGIGVADMAAAIENGGDHRASGRLAYHVLDIMHAVHDASDAGSHVMLESECDRPEPLAMSLLQGEVR